MTEVISRSERVRRAARTAPYLIPLYMRTFNPSLTKWTLYDMLPFRTSLEIECFGSLHWGHLLHTGEILSVNTLLNDFKLVSYNEDFGRNLNDINGQNLIKGILRNINTFDGKNDFIANVILIFGCYPGEELKKILNLLQDKYNVAFNTLHHGLTNIDYWDRDYLSYNEHRISIPNYTGLYGLYKLLNLMKQYSIPNPGSGIHIHVDFTNLEKAGMNPAYDGGDKIKVRNIITPLLDEIGHIFNEDITVWQQKAFGNWIRFNYPNGNLTLEFRLGDMTFDYETIVGWMIKCNSFAKKLYGLLGVDYKTGKRLDLKPKVEPIKRKISIFDDSLDWD